MRWRGPVYFLSLLFVAVCGPALASDMPREASQAQYPGNRVMVMLELGAEHYRSGSGYGGAYGDAMGQQIRNRLASKIARKHDLTLVESWPMERIGVDCVVMEIHDARKVDAVVAELSREKGVAWSQPLNEFRVQGSGTQSYNDKLYRAQPVAARWKLAQLHRLATGRGIKIAIIDSRIDTGHPDLAGQIGATPDFVDPRTNRAERHGTGIAGIIAAKPGNAIGIAGIAPEAKILGLRACWEKPDGASTVCNSLSLAKALVYAIDARSDVINLSLAGPDDRLLEMLVLKAIAQGATVVAAVDPERTRSSFPAMIRGVVPVADESLSAQSARVYIAPGQDVLTTEPEGKWGIVNGSSYAAAHASGLAALLRQLVEKRRNGRVPADIFGDRGTIDVCAAIARISPADARSCT